MYEDDELDYIYEECDYAGEKELAHQSKQIQLEADIRSGWAK